MSSDDWKYGSVANETDDARRGALLLTDDVAGVEIRRLARKYRINPACDHGPELLDRLDNPLLRARYFSKRGIGLDEFANLLSGTVTVGRANLGRVVELLEHFLRGRRMTRAEKLAQAARELETRNVARELVARQESAVTAYHNRTKRGTKLVAWQCECSAGVAIWASFRVEVDATCNACRAIYRRKVALPTLDEAACIASTESDHEETPF